MAALDGTLGVVFPDGNIQTYAQSLVRQTVVNGPVDTNGQSAFGGVIGATTVTTTATLYLSAANGMTNRNSNALVNPSWTGLSTNGTMYLYVTNNIDGTCTLVSTTLAPIYQFGGTPSTVNGQFTFNVQQMVGYVGNGTTAAQSYTVFVGEVTVASNVVSAIVWYALMGRYSGLTTSYVANTSYNFNHYIGVPIELLTVAPYSRTSSAVPWLPNTQGYSNTGYPNVGVANGISRLNVKLITGSSGMWVDSGTSFGGTSATGDLLVRVQRSW